jgi:dTDP-4-dehydrorhamnose 3,5-epimerase-like enzyme
MIYYGMENFDQKEPILLPCKSFVDQRGEFTRISPLPLNRSFEIRDVFITTSKKDVVRGIHFFDSESEVKRLVSCISGSVRDILIDLRISSSNFGKVYENILSENHGAILPIAPGFGHGIISLEDDSRLLYLTDRITSKADQEGIAISSLDIELPENYVISPQDEALQTFENFKNSFRNL